MPQTSAAARSSVAPGDAFDVLARIESRSAALRRLPRPDAAWRRRGRLLVRGDRDPSLLHIDLAADGWTPVEERPRVAADALLLSGHPGVRLASRAFYLDAGVTVALKEARLRPSRLLAGSRVAARFADDDALLVPHQLERGRRLRHAWVVEEHLPGLPARRREWPELIERLVEGITGLWRQAEARPVPVRRVVPWLAAHRVRGLLDEMGLSAASPARIEATVERIAGADEMLLVGWTHGDPVPNNVLRLDDGRLALVDWERAGRNPLGLDACRMLAALDDATESIAMLERRFEPMRRAGILSLRDQAIIALVGLLPTWAAQRDAWHGAGRETGYGVRNARRLRLLEALAES